MRYLLIIFVLIFFPVISKSQSITSDLQATKKTKALFANLKEISGKGILFGHQDDPAYGIGWKAEKGRSDIKETCGAYPALYGWDVSGLGRSFNIDSVDFENMKRWIRQAYRRGGVNTVSWHMDNPATGGNSWDNTPAVSAVLPGGPKHAWYKQKLDLFADFLNDLKSGLFGKKIPIIFRPFHEHTGSWFWWGKGNCTAEEYKSLWQFTVKYLTEEKQIHQLLYSYSTDRFDSGEQYLEFYPGDEYVDIIAFDDYHSIKDMEGRDQLIYRLRTVNEIAKEKQKVSALSETGVETIPADDWFTNILLDGILSDDGGKGISYVMVWRNAWPHHFYAPYPGHATVPDFIRFRKDPYTLFEPDLPNMYKMPKGVL